MKTELEQADIKLIAEEVVQMLMPLIAEHSDQKEADEILTPDELVELLKVKKPQIYAWVNESKYSNDGIPFDKAGKFLRFSKIAVLKWMKNR